MGKDWSTHGRRKRKGEAQKRKKRRGARAEAWKITDDGAGPRDLNRPDRHHRQPRRGRA